MPTENLIQNGTFNQPAVPGQTKSWRGVYQNLPYRATGWEPANFWGYDHLNTHFAHHPSGYQAADLGREFTQGGMKQTIDTKAGVTYTLTFECSPNEWVNCNGKPNTFSVKVTDANADQELTSREFDPGVGYGQANWQQKEVSFQALGSRTTISFLGTAYASCQSGITNVSVIGRTEVTEVKEPDPGTGGGTAVVPGGQDQQALNDCKGTVDELTGQVGDLQGKLAECQKTGQELRQSLKDSAAEYVRGKRQGREAAMKQWRETGEVTL